MCCHLKWLALAVDMCTANTENDHVSKDKNVSGRGDILVTSTIIDILENIRFGEEKPTWTKSPCGAMLLKAPCAFNTYFCCLRDSELQVLYRDAVWWIRAGINSQLSSTSALSTDLKGIQNPPIYSGISEQIKPLQLVGHARELSLSPTSSPFRSFGNDTQRLFQKTIEGFDCKINGQALGAVLLLCLGWLD